MKNEIVNFLVTKGVTPNKELIVPEKLNFHEIISENNNMQNIKSEWENKQSEDLVITSYPTRECGIANYSHDLIKSLNNKFGVSFNNKVCAVEDTETVNFSYPAELNYRLCSTNALEYPKLAHSINNNDLIKIVVIQHEFGFYHEQEAAFLQFLQELNKPVIIFFHTVLPHPDKIRRKAVKNIIDAAVSVIVMTNNAGQVLINDYNISHKKIAVIAHGTHLVQHLSKDFLKKKYKLTGKKVLSNFGLLRSGKSIETTLYALPAIVETHPDVMFLVLGKTHPSVMKSEGEMYRIMLEKTVKDLNPQKYVKF